MNPDPPNSDPPSTDRPQSDRPDSDGAAESGGEEAADPDGISGSRVSGSRATAIHLDEPVPARDAPVRNVAELEAELDVQNPGGLAEGELRDLSSWLEGVLGELAPEAATMTLRLVSDEEMRELNREYRGIDQSTDVLSFAGDLPPRRDATASRQGAEEGPAVPLPPGHPPHLGDVVIALPTAKRQAQARSHSLRSHSFRSHSLQHELRILSLHGVLHCLGYDHESDDGTMERLESQLRQRFLDMPEGSGPDGAADSATDSAATDSAKGSETDRAAASP